MEGKEKGEGDREVVVECKPPYSMGVYTPPLLMIMVPMPSGLQDPVYESGMTMVVDKYVHGVYK